MRDSQIIEMNNRWERARDLLFRQFQFIEARFRALEQVLADRPEFKDIKDAVDAKHQAILADENRKLFEALQAAQEEARKPKLTLLS